jgi:hypothetical protein
VHGRNSAHFAFDVRQETQERKTLDLRVECFPLTLSLSRIGVRQGVSAKACLPLLDNSVSLDDDNMFGNGPFDKQKSTIHVHEIKSQNKLEVS